ncbi:hypothetical protein N7466_003254 [Penicillium verhagenii]|uniref:uncharacterized protein n=1 Tax=Penicillium verhagenii TaxID=1562060 RepID=UPI0025454C92|nr:uncharacterized protein N7466_003254 [Penicillium verhagenii]KAJ5936804.1 hypothetical protein N7466_003254 [Penicillium verhagenii]
MTVMIPPIEGEEYPHWIDVWTSYVHPIAAFRTESGYTGMNISLQSSECCNSQLPGSLPANIRPLSWTLVVEDWGPAKTNETGAASPDTMKVTLPALHLPKLAP